MRNEKGFTLIELISVMIVLGVLAVAFLPKVINMDKTAQIQALDRGIQELNQREKLVWSKIKISDDSYSDKELDEVIITQMDRNLSDGYQWKGEVLYFKSSSLTLERIPATNRIPAIWREKTS
jgi:prepilin-type N-terminal cleavage/methylation domain-containing protein